MNKKTSITLDDYTVFRLLCELGRGEVQSQRDLARRLDSALGLVNGYLKVGADKGWVRVKELSSNRSSYQLTSKGVQEQRRLAIRHAGYLGDMLTVVQDEYRQIGRQLTEEGVERVALCGADGLAEIVRMVLQEAQIEVSLVMDTSGVGSQCMGKDVVSLAHAMLGGVHHTVISSITRTAELRAALIDLGTNPSTIKVPQLFLERP